jgi:hypothetical protein
LRVSLARRWKFILPAAAIIVLLAVLTPLRWHRGAEAAEEFQKILAHRTISALSVIHPLSQLSLARALALQGDSAHARIAYQDFFALWKDADPTSPSYSPPNPNTRNYSSFY